MFRSFYIFKYSFTATLNCIHHMRTIRKVLITLGIVQETLTNEKKLSWQILYRLFIFCHLLLN